LQGLDPTEIRKGFRGYHIEFRRREVARRETDAGSESTISLVESVDQAADHSGDDTEPLFESKRDGIFRQARKATWEHRSSTSTATAISTS
jgi:hypothetical protein